MSTPQSMPRPARPVARREAATTSAGLVGVATAFAVGAAVSIGLGVYGRLHKPTGVAVNLAGFSSPVAVKAWLATVAFLFALFQLASALVMYGKVPGVRAPAWIGLAHRWSGRIAVLVSVPVAVQCLYALGFQSFGMRGLVHSVLGCFLYGAFTAKMLILSRRQTPAWALPLAGGMVFAAFVGLWLTAGLWFFRTFGLTL
ncbi:MAG: hypothetical protein QOI26_212 [Pseudonocardiales bacterium]|jgi:hypothetical protein|nr:hypothetical protein [Pseudonocardiales bacterium]